ncbi:MAG: hypothetical protein JJE55_04730 [Flavobacteriaceae bacterium]|nr:hypothetical protein [Flavobacteriaceae bacterium]
MASQSEKTFGSRLYNAEQLSTNVATFTGYVALTPETTVAAYNTLINEVGQNNTLIATLQSPFSLAVAARQNLFEKDPTSLARTLSPIAAFVKAKFGKTSKQAADITNLVNKIRGEKTAELKKDEEGEFVSQSHRSFGSQTQFLADIIATLTSYGTDYAPTNPNITLEQLSTLLDSLTAVNTAVTTAYGQLKPVKDVRKLQYEDLSKRSQTIKETVKSQYGVQSTEYKLIKGFKI